MFQYSSHYLHASLLSTVIAFNSWRNSTCVNTSVTFLWWKSKIFLLIVGTHPIFPFDFMHFFLQFVSFRKFQFILRAIIDSVCILPFMIMSCPDFNSHVQSKVLWFQHGFLNFHWRISCHKFVSDTFVRRVSWEIAFSCLVPVLRYIFWYFLIFILHGLAREREESDANFPDQNAQHNSVTPLDTARSLPY